MQMHWYLNVLKKYAEFDGRARRKEYWLFFLINMFVAILLMMLDAGIGTLSTDTGWGMLSGLYTLGVMLPSLAVAVRRLHDTGRSGWWLLLSLIPLVGLVVLVFMLLDGDRGNNRFGEDPKSRESVVPALA
jgi:uncharacterized membrane protein YhaH (DUF805 family)